MRSTLEEEEELEQLDARSEYGRRDHAEQDREVTISSTTLLAIFFGLALICALFFAFGYTLGRRSSSDTSQPVAASRSGGDAGTLQLASSQGSSQGKPSAGAQSNSAAAPAQSDTETADPSNGAGGASTAPPYTLTQESPSSAVTPTPPSVVSAPRPAPAPVSQIPAAASNGPLFPSAAPALMVQIAAVSNPADADVLVSALHKRGYSVIVRRETGDALMHVQVGPFQTRADAIAMRQKLLADGYNAILK